MKAKTVCLGAKCSVVIAAAWALGAGQPVQAKPLGQATVTSMNNDVRYTPATAAERRARLRDVVRGADLLRTGLKSQAELEFEDRTITRLGSTSVFSFDPEKRQLMLKTGVLVFDMPKNAGGGRIVTPAGTAAIEGTAGIVSYRSPLKVICLAGVIRVTDPKGRLLSVLNAGQMYIQGITARAVDVNLRRMGNGKLLQGGLPNNQSEHDDAAKEQQEKIKTGQLEETPFVMFGEGTDVLMARQQLAMSASQAAIESRQLQNEVNTILEAIFNPNLPPVIATTGDKISSNPPVISDSQGKTKNTGTIGEFTGAANFSGPYIEFTGDPAFAAPPSETFRALFTTAGWVDVDGFGWNDAPGDTTLYRGYDVSLFGSYVSIRDSKIGRHITTGEGGMLFVRSLSDIIVDPSLLVASSDGTRGYIWLAADGRIDFLGNSSFFTEANASGFDGLSSGSISRGVEMDSRGTAAGDGLFLENAFIDVTAPNSPLAQGGEVVLKGKREVSIKETTDIQANGYTAGTIQVESARAVNMEALTDYVRLSAQDGLSVLNGLTQPGEIQIIGADRGANGKTINIVASGAAGGGSIVASATQAITIHNARLSADATGTLPAGIVHLAARDITINNSIISASSVGGVAGRINIYGDVASGAVNVLNSSLTTAGATAGANSGIYIKGNTVNLAGTTLNPGPAKVHIISNSNTGGWSTVPTDTIHWHQAGSDGAHF